MVNDEVKRAVVKALVNAGIDRTVISDLIAERKRLRDEFAMAAINACMRKGYDDPVAQAYIIADRMLKARES